MTINCHYQSPQSLLRGLQYQSKIYISPARYFVMVRRSSSNIIKEGRGDGGRALLLFAINGQELIPFLRMGEPLWVTTGMWYTSWVVYTLWAKSSSSSRTMIRDGTSESLVEFKTDILSFKSCPSVFISRFGISLKKWLWKFSIGLWRVPSWLNKVHFRNKYGNVCMFPMF